MSGHAAVQDFVTELHMQSIFTDVGKQSLQDPSNSAVVPSLVGQMGCPITSTAWLSQSGEAHYALASPAGGIVIVVLPPHDTQGREHLVCFTVPAWRALWVPAFLRLKQICFLSFRWCVRPGAKEELHDAEAVRVDAHSDPRGAQSV